MAQEVKRDPDLEWLDHVRPIGLVVAPVLLKELGLPPLRQTQLDSAVVAAHIGDDDRKPAMADPWGFVRDVLGWEAAHVAGSPDGPPLPGDLHVALPEHATTLSPTWAVKELAESKRPWQLLVRIEQTGIDPDARAMHGGWEATAHQRFERLLRETGVHAGVLITERSEHKDGEDRFHPELRLLYAPKGETSGYVTFRLRDLRTVAGRSMLGGLKLLLDSVRLFADASDRRLPALLEKSREAQAAVSITLAEQVLGALHELLRGLDAAAPTLIHELARERPAHLYEGLLTVLMRLVFVLYAEDRELLPSRIDSHARELYETGYSLRGLYDRLTRDAALNPDTMDERRGGWGGVLALFRLIHKGHKSHFVQARGGKLFDPDEFPFLEGRASMDDPVRILGLSDGCLLRILEGLMTLKARRGERERLSYRTLDVEQIGSVYETVMGFTVERARNRVLAIRAGKNNRTPVFVALDELLAKRGKHRIKDLRKNVGRSLTAAQGKSVEAAKTVEDLAAALDGMVDERASPKKRIAAPGTPILQPTGERRRSGSHYTPRSLTAPIVKHALEPAFERLGLDAKPGQILDLRVCDPAMGSGAFLVEACRALGERLVAAWARWPETRPRIPADEDEELHARRLVAQHCLYGVDKNPRAVDLAKLSLWLATLARDHEFTFLDHALKCGDSLVGLTKDQISATHWDTTKPPTFVGKLVSDHLREAEQDRALIREQAEWASEAELQPRFKAAEAKLRVARLIGDGILAAFYSADKAKERIEQLVSFQKLVQGNLGSREWEEKAVLFLQAQRPDKSTIVPFHWNIEFPEVFARENGGFDAVIGNPPFLGGKRISEEFGTTYRDWLATLHYRSTRNIDLVGHFFLRSFGLLRRNGVCGLIGTNTLAQGDTREGSIAIILSDGGAISRAEKRIRWPGEAAVVVSVVHIMKGAVRSPHLNNRPVHRISAYLVEGDFDRSPSQLAANSRKAFQGSIVLGMGFTFDDQAAAKGAAASLADMEAIIEQGEKFKERIFPYIGGEELSTSPMQANHRFVINVNDLPIDQIEHDLRPLFKVLESYVRPERQTEKNKKNGPMFYEWWRYWRERPDLYRSIKNLKRAFALSRVSAQMSVVSVPTNVIFADSCVVFAYETFAPFTVLQSRVHEIWARFFSSSMKDDLRYAPSDCFRTFPFPEGFETDEALETIGNRYHAYRAQVMTDRNVGLTKIYNRFHSRSDGAPDIVHLRELHARLDVAALRAYGRSEPNSRKAAVWNDLADRAAPEFSEQNADEGKRPKTRYDWPSEFKDEVLAQLLATNDERAAAEREAGLIVEVEEDEENEGEIDDDEGEDA